MLLFPSSHWRTAAARLGVTELKRCFIDLVESIRAVTAGRSFTLLKRPGAVRTIELTRAAKEGTNVEAPDSVKAASRLDSVITMFTDRRATNARSRRNL